LSPAGPTQPGLSQAGLSPAGDTLLRPALEAAMSVARAGEEATPSEPPPPALRPFLHFAKLPRPALVAARRVLDADEEFRARVLDAVTESDVGRSGWIYLARPEGWEDELAALLADVEDAGAAAGERRAEGDARKRLAGAEAARRRAEEAAAAAEVESTRAVAALSDERKARRAAADDVARLERRLAQVTVERDRAREAARKAAQESEEGGRLVAELRFALDQALAEVAAATERAEADEARRQAALRSAPSPGPGTGPATGPGSGSGSGSGRAGLVGSGSGPAGRAGSGSQSGGGSAAGAGVGAGRAMPGEVGMAGGGGPGSNDRPPVDTAGAAVALEQAAQAAAALAEALSGVATSLKPPAPPLPAETSGTPPAADAPVPATRGPRAVRRVRPPAPQPVPLPPGIFDDSVEAAEHLVRVPGVVLLVDGYNVSQLGWPEVPIAEQRQRLVDALAELAARSGAEITVVFDGAETAYPGVVPGIARPVRVVFSPPGVEADDVVIGRVAELRPFRPVVVASSDRRVQAGAAQSGGNVISSPQLLAVLRR
jgi:predicted RNA-binding protein with PIN domain